MNFQAFSKTSGISDPVRRSAGNGPALLPPEKILCFSSPALVFDEPVSGPVLVGSGRFQGYGDCRPLEAL